MATPITLTNLPGSDRIFNIALNAGVTPYVVRSWEADTIDEDIKRTDLDGAVKVVKKRKRKTLALRGVIHDRATRRTIEDLIDSGDPICVNPPWVDATGSTVLTYLPLQKTLSDMLAENIRSSIAFERFSGRFNRITGRKTPFNEPHYEDGVFGQGLNIEDPAYEDADGGHWFHPELRSYLTRDAADSGATTLIYVTPAQAVLWDNYGTAVWPAGNKAFLTISNEEESTNAHEIALISAINTTTGLVTLTTTDGTAVLGGTANYTYDKRTYISSVLVSDCEMSDSGTGSWADNGTASLIEKSDTQRETGSRCLRVIGGGAARGTLQEIGALPAGTDLVIWARVSAIRGRAVAAGPVDLQIRNTTDGVNELSEAQVLSAYSTYTWFQYAFEVARGGAGQKTLQIHVEQPDGTEAEFLVDRVYIWQNSVDNGGMEPASGDTYDAEDVAITTSTPANTTYAGNVCTDDGLAGLWDLSDAVIGNYASESGGAYGRINAVNDIGLGANIVVDAWINGPPVNGNACAVHFAVAPAWNEVGCTPGDDNLSQDEDEHGGTYAQRIQADDDQGTRQLITWVDGVYYLAGAYGKLLAGNAGEVFSFPVLEAIIFDDATYTFHASIALGDGAAHQFQIISSGASEFLIDDIMLVRLPGNPRDDAYYRLSKPIGTDTGFTVIGSWRPNISSTVLDRDAYQLAISEDTYDSNNVIFFHYDKVNTRIEMFVCSGGACVAATPTATFSAADSVFFAGKGDNGGDGATTIKAWIKINQGAEVTNTQVNATVPPGLTKMWIGQTGDSAQHFPNRGTLTNLLVVNEELSDQEITDILELWSAEDADRRSLVDETHGILYEIRRGGVRVRSTGIGDEFRADIVLTELDRIGAIAKRDVA